MTTLLAEIQQRIEDMDLGTCDDDYQLGWSRAIQSMIDELSTLDTTESALPAPPVTVETVAYDIEIATLEAEAARWRQTARRMALYARWWRALHVFVVLTNHRADQPDISRAVDHLARLDREVMRTEGDDGHLARIDEEAKR